MIANGDIVEATRINGFKKVIIQINESPSRAIKHEDVIHQFRKSLKNVSPEAGRTEQKKGLF